MYGGLELLKIVVYYESIKREIKIKPVSESRCDERLKTKIEESTCLSDIGLFGVLEHLKIKTKTQDNPGFEFGRD